MISFCGGQREIVNSLFLEEGCVDSGKGEVKAKVSDLLLYQLSFVF